MGDFGHLPGLGVLLAMALLAGSANADRPYGFAPLATHGARSSVMLAQTFHNRPGIPGSNDSGDSSDLGGSSDGTHVPPAVPNFSDSGRRSGVSHAAPGLPSFGDGGGNAAVQSHAPRPAPNETGGSHAAPGVPMMGGNP